MKNHYSLLWLCAFLFFSQRGFSQLVSAYSFNQYQGTYAAISGGTVFGTSSNNDQVFTDPANTAGGTIVTGPGLPIGFSFVYNNVTYDCFGINTNGWISLGQTGITPNAVDLSTSNAFNAISATSAAPANLQCRIAALGVNLFAGPSSELSAETIGTAPNRTLVVQWTNYTRFFDLKNSFNFQIRLCETSNQVQIIYGDFFMIRTTAVTAQVGLRGQANTNFNIRTVAATGSWAASAAGTANTQVCNFNTNTAPAKGQVYEWAPAVPCSGMPVASAPVASSTNACAGTGVSLSVHSAYAHISGLSFQWESSASGTPGSFSPITSGPGSGTTAAISLSPSASMFYQAVVTCTINGSFSTTTTPVQVNIGLPATATALSNNTLVCYGSGAGISLAPSNSGLASQWQSSQTAGGPYTVIPNASLTTLAATNITTTTYYQAIVSCIGSPVPAATILSTPVTVSVIPTITNTVPYLETFESISDNYQFPNCQWLDSSPTPVFLTYTNQGGGFNQMNHTPGGSKFASLLYFVNNNALFSNGIFLNAGVNYRGSVWYITDGLPSWFDFSLGISSVQAVSSITNIASASFPSNTTYRRLSGTFTVPVSGIYYLGVSALGDENNAAISFDDLAIDVACELNPEVAFQVNGPTAVCAGSNGDLSAVAGTGIFAATSYTWNTGLASHSISTSPGTSYTVTATNTLGCSTAKTVFINTHPLPGISVFSTPEAVCSGDAVSLVALGGANTFTWSNGMTSAVNVVSPTVTASYTVEGTDANGCSNKASKMITVHEQPVISVAASRTVFCRGEKVSLEGSGGQTYTWSSPETFLSGQSVLVSPEQSTTYTVSGTDNNKCTGSATIRLLMSSCTGIEDLFASNSQLSVYPNPNKGEFSVELKDGRVHRIEVTDVSGRILISQPGEETGKTPLNIQELASGIYYVKVLTETRSEVIKVIKE